jgi:hypothetical protein
VANGVGYGDGQVEQGGEHLPSAIPLWNRPEQRVEDVLWKIDPLVFILYFKFYLIFPTRFKYSLDNIYIFTVYFQNLSKTAKQLVRHFEHIVEDVS